MLKTTSFKSRAAQFKTVKHLQVTDSQTTPIIHAIISHDFYYKPHGFRDRAAEIGVIKISVMIIHIYRHR